MDHALMGRGLMGGKVGLLLVLEDVELGLG